MCVLCVMCVCVFVCVIRLCILCVHTLASRVCVSVCVTRASTHSLRSCVCACRMKKNSLELKRRQIQMLIDAENADLAKKAKRQATRAEKAQKLAEAGEVVMTETKQKFKRGRILPRREYKAKRRQAKLASRFGPRDVEMKQQKVSKTMRLVKDKASIRK